MPRWRRRLLTVVVAIAVLAGATYAGLAVSTSRSQLARAVLWGESDVGDYQRFPVHWIAAGPSRFRFHRPAGGSYFNGYQHDSIQTSMSIAKSVHGALVGVAIGQGRIGSVEDPITRYVPELLARDRRFGRITLRHLLTMRSGLRHQEGAHPGATIPPPTTRRTCVRWPWGEPRSSRRRGAGSTTATSTRCWSGWRWSGRSTSPSSGCCTPPFPTTRDRAPDRL
jgi:hypothetical protein